MGNFAAFGDPIAGLNDAALAAWSNVAGVTTYGTPQDCMSVQMFGSAVDTVTADLTGDDRITATFARLISGEINVRFAGQLLAVLAVVFGIPIVASGTTPSRIQHFRIVGGSRNPYFGMQGLGLAEEGLGDMVVFVPKIKVTSQIKLTNMEYGAWQICEFTAKAVDDQDWGIINLIPHETTGAFAWPPAGIVALA
jgi:hypothetical protein